jgi:hypothetical protein
MKRITALLFASAALITGCSKKENAIPPVDYSYFPTQIGHYVIYDADSVVHSAFDKKTYVFRFQIKDVIESTFTDNSGRQVQRVERYKRDTVTMPWRFQQAFTLHLSNNIAERFENNRTFICLTFPPSPGKSWVSNAYDRDVKWQYRYTSISAPITIGSHSLPSTHTVTQIDEENLIMKEYSVEKYARNIGLVYKEFIRDSAEVITSEPLMNRISGGTEYKLTLHSYGQQ